MTMVSIVITAATTLLAVALGGWISTRTQRWAWRTEQTQRWTDRRLNYYSAFLEAFREYVAYVQAPGAEVATHQRSRPPHDVMPVLHGAGLGYAQRLDAAKTIVRLVSSSAAVVEASRELVHAARLLAAAHAADAAAPVLYTQLWEAEKVFVRAAREELGTNTPHSEEE